MNPTESPLPTPYDILPPSYIPPTVGALAFLGLFAFTALLFFILSRKKQPHYKKAAPLSRLNSAVDALIRKGSPTLSKLEAEHLSFLLRALLTVTEGRSFQHASPKELIVLLKNLPSQRRTLAEILIVLEEATYRPEGKVAEAARILSSLQSALQIIMEPVKNKKEAA